jgi:hypothetical protein
MKKRLLCLLYDKKWERWESEVFQARLDKQSVYDGLCTPQAGLKSKGCVFLGRVGVWHP